MGTLSKRIVVRLADEDDAWIAEQAEQEGVDNATFVRMLINRLRRGRPALVGMSPQQLLQDQQSPMQWADGDPDEIERLLSDRLVSATEAVVTAAPPTSNANVEPYSNGGVAVSLRQAPKRLPRDYR